MEKQTGQVREEIENTRDALYEKLELLEEHTRDTIESTKEKVKQTFDLTYHVEQRPWTMVSAAVAVGYMLGHLSSPRTERAQSRSFSYESTAQPFSVSAPAESTPGVTSAASSMVKKQSSNIAWFLGQVQEQFHDEIELLKGAALGAVSSALRDVVKQFVPNITSALQAESGRNPQPASSTSQINVNGKTNF